MESKTYTKRENAKRAAIAAGLLAELVEITVHKKGGEVRFGWKKREVPVPISVGPAVTTREPNRDTALKVQHQPRVESNGVKRPGPGKCLEVWEYLDQHGNMMSKDLKPLAAAKGWNENNALIELYGWRKFNGIAGRLKASA